MEDDFGLGCAAGPHHRRGEDGRIWHFTKSEKSEYEYTASAGAGDPKECQVLWPPLLFMVACTVLCGNQISGAPRVGSMCFRSRIGSMAWRFHAIDATSSS